MIQNKQFNILNELRGELIENINEKVLNSGKKFFKEEVKSYGVGTSIVSKIGEKYFKLIKDLPKKEIFDLCEDLWKSGYNEEAWIACNWSYYLTDKYEPNDFQAFQNWVYKYVTNWAACDTLCNHTVGDFVMKFPEFMPHFKLWARSDNRWVRRAAAVTFIIPARKGLFLNDILEIADTLLLDKDDMVQKGYGWMLKAASLTETTAASKKLDPKTKQKHTEIVFNYVIKHKAVMPRTALRYAIEKMPADMKAEAMKK